MVTTAQIQHIIEENIVDTDIFIVEVKVVPGRIMVFLDKPTGITIQECGRICRKLLNTLEETGILEVNDIDVSSPGMDYPLRVMQQYERHIGRQVNVKMQDGSEHEGKLLSATADNIELEETLTRKEGKKKVTETAVLSMPFTTIKEVKLVISFK